MSEKANRENSLPRTNLKRGSVAEGTLIALSNGRRIPIQEVMPNTSVLCWNGPSGITSNELLVDNGVEYLYGINKQVPFMSLDRILWTKSGWKSMLPEAAGKANPGYDITLLKEGDQCLIYEGLVRGRPTFTLTEVEKITVVRNERKVKCYDIEMIEGNNACFVGGVCCLVNVPETLLRKSY